jgi:hypothetical protein
MESPNYNAVQLRYYIIIIIYLNAWTLYQTAELLFTGTFRGRSFSRQRSYNPSLFDEWLPAVSSRGVTIFVSTLLGLFDRPDQVKILHVLPGVIELSSGVQYRRVTDGHDPLVGYDAGDYEDLTDTIEMKDTANSNLRSELNVKETIDELLISFSFSSCAGKITRIGPARLLLSMLYSAGMIHCRRHACRMVSSPYCNTSVVDGEGQVFWNKDLEAGRRVVVRRLSGNMLARCIAVSTPLEVKEDGEFVNLLGNKTVSTFLRLDECLSCCLTAALDSGHDVVYIIWLFARGE